MFFFFIGFWKLWCHYQSTPNTNIPSLIAGTQPRVHLAPLQDGGGQSNGRRRRATDEPDNGPPRRLTRASARRFISLDESSDDDFVMWMSKKLLFVLAFCWNEKIIWLP